MTQFLTKNSMPNYIIILNFLTSVLSNPIVPNKNISEDREIIIPVQSPDICALPEELGYNGKYLNNIITLDMVCV